jgi:dipeptidyl aminopeptidase/acylaminoacyl peptidase
MWKKLIAVAIAIVIVVGFFVTVSYLEANILVTNPMEKRYKPEKTPADYGLTYEDLSLQAKDGLKISGWYIPSQNGAVVIDIHGYKGCREWLLEPAKMLSGHGYGVMLIDLRTHGLSEGDIITFGRTEVYDVDAALEYLLHRPEVDPSRIGIIGHSIGGAVAILYASKNPVIKTVISDCAYVSLNEEVNTALEKFGVPSVLSPMILNFAEKKMGFKVDNYAPVKYIGAISPRPILLMQGGKDDMVPSDSGKRLYEAAGEPKELWFEPELNHVCFLTDMPKEYETRVTGFLDKYLLK